MCSSRSLGVVGPYPQTQETTGFGVAGWVVVMIASSRLGWVGVSERGQDSARVVKIADARVVGGVKRRALSRRRR